MREKLSPSTNGLEAMMKKKIEALEDPWAWADNFLKKIDSLDGRVPEATKERLRDHFTNLFLSLTGERNAPLTENSPPVKKPEKSKENGNGKEERRKQGLSQLPAKQKIIYHSERNNWQSDRAARKSGRKKDMENHRHHRIAT